MLPPWARLVLLVLCVREERAFFRLSGNGSIHIFFRLEPILSGFGLHLSNCLFQVPISMKRRGVAAVFGVKFIIHSALIGLSDVKKHTFKIHKFVSAWLRVKCTRPATVFKLQSESVHWKLSKLCSYFCNNDRFQVSQTNTVLLPLSVVLGGWWVLGMHLRAVLFEILLCMLGPL